MQEISTISEALKKDIRSGLSSNPKYIPSKYFYDDTGSRIFQNIMHMPEYYLTDCEYEIFENQKGKILSEIKPNGEDIDLIELGAGDGLKTSLLIEHLMDNGIHFTYIPVDISEKAITLLVEKMQIKFPYLKLSEKIGDYFEIMGKLKTCNNCKKLTLFLGSNIGNFSRNESVVFFGNLSMLIKKGDFVLTGFDLIKDPETILNAYNDRQGHTRNFNLNLLTRLNRELSADFDLNKFMHYPVYDPGDNTAKSYLISQEKQKVYLKELDQEFLFDKWESILTEISRKFSEKDITELASITGFRVVKNFYDRRGYYTNSLWMKI